MNLQQIFNNAWIGAKSKDPPMNLQQIFNNAWIGAKSKGFALSITSIGVCRYRGGNGNCCAIGWSIPDDKYDVDMEGEGINCNQSVKNVLKYDGNLSDLVRLQKCHDQVAINGETDGAYEQNLRQFAHDFNLEIPQ